MSTHKDDCQWDAMFAEMWCSDACRAEARAERKSRRRERIQKFFSFLADDRARYVGSAEVVGLEPGPNFVAPVMALDSLAPEDPTTLVMTIHDYPEVPILCGGTEETIAEDMDFFYHNWPTYLWPNYFIMEVQT